MKITDWSQADAMTGSQSVGTSPVQMSTTAKQLAKGVFIKVAKTNIGFVYVGFAANVTAGSATPATDGYPLPPGEELPFAIDRLDKVWLIASSPGHAVNFLAQVMEIVAWTFATWFSSAMTHNISNTSIEAGRTMEPLRRSARPGVGVSGLQARRRRDQRGNRRAPTDEDSKCYPAGVRAAQSAAWSRTADTGGRLWPRQSQSLACASRAARSWFLIPFCCGVDNVRLDASDLADLQPLIEAAVAPTLNEIEANEHKFNGRLGYTEAEAADLIGVPDHTPRDCRLRGELIGRLVARKSCTSGELLRLFADEAIKSPKHGGR